jgi:hypothetical protein
METVCETCRFYDNGIKLPCLLNKKISVLSEPDKQYCDSWEDEEGNTILGEDW